MSVLLFLFLLHRALALGWGGKLLVIVIISILIIVLQLLRSVTFAGCGCGLAGANFGTSRIAVAGFAVGRPGLLAKLLVMLTSGYQYTIRYSACESDSKL